MWKYIKGTEKDFKEFMPSSIVVIKDGCTIARREWIEEPSVETNQEQQSLPSVSDMNPAKDLPKIKLDVKKPVFHKVSNEEVRFIHANKLCYLFETNDCTILSANVDNLDDCFYNKPDIKTTEQLISDAWTYACNDGSLWASPTQLYYIAIKELIKNGVIDVSKIHEVSDDTNK